MAPPSVFYGHNVIEVRCDGSRLVSYISKNRRHREGEESVWRWIQEITRRRGKNTILRRITLKSLGVIRDVTDTGDSLLIVKLIDTPYFIAIHLIKCVTLYVSIADVRTCFA